MGIASAWQRTIPPKKKIPTSPLDQNAQRFLCVGHRNASQECPRKQQQKNRKYIYMHDTRRSHDDSTKHTATNDAIDNEATRRTGVSQLPPKKVSPRCPASYLVPKLNIL